MEIQFYCIIQMTSSRNGKILDLFVRISQDDQKTYFFLPGDNEISSKYLNWQLEKAKHYKCKTKLKLR